LSNQVSVRILGSEVISHFMEKIIKTSKNRVIKYPIFTGTVLGFALPRPVSQELA
jgi:hypothetical protein